jgi:short-subunit dehydrogenase
MPVKATYAASKRFLLDFSLALREEVRPLGATVTVLCPAGLPTTPECIRAIEAQGLMGQLTTQDIGSVAAGTLDCALKGRAVYIPGLFNRMLQMLGALAPASLVASLIGHRWRATHQMRLEYTTDAHG